MPTYLDPHSVPVEYFKWQTDEERIRAFLTSTNRGMGAWFDARWEAAGVEADRTFNPDEHGEDLQAVLFEDDIGVWPPDYFWQLSSAVVKDAFALYEIFLEQLADAVLRRSGAGLRNLETTRSWHWDQCEAFYAHYVGVDVLPPKIQAAQWMRNKLAHLRDQLRTQEGVSEFEAHLGTLDVDGPLTAEEVDLRLTEHRPYMRRGVHLTQLQTWRLLDVLADHISTIALVAFPLVHGSETNSYLTAVRAKAPLDVPHLPARKLIAL